MKCFWIVDENWTQHRRYTRVFVVCLREYCVYHLRQLNTIFVVSTNSSFSQYKRIHCHAVYGYVAKSFAVIRLYCQWQFATNTFKNIEIFSVSSTKIGSFIASLKKKQCQPNHFIWMATTMSSRVICIERVLLDVIFWAEIKASKEQNLCGQFF